MTRVNSDRVFFGKTDTRYVNFAYSGNGVTAPIVNMDTGAVVSEPVEVEVPDRDYAIEFGVESLIDGDWRDHTARISRRQWYTWRVRVVGVLFLALDLGAHVFLAHGGRFLQECALNDYYWGVSADEANLALPEYHAGGGFGFKVDWLRTTTSAATFASRCRSTMKSLRMMSPPARSPTTIT